MTEAAARSVQDMLDDANVFEPDELREWATAMLRTHDPGQQEGNPYDRCEVCNYCRAPCDTFDLAAAIIRLLDGQAAGRPG